MAGEADVIVATSAFGMGINKPDVRYVLSMGISDSLEAYYQQAGRAGRDGLPAECILLWSSDDLLSWDFLIERSLQSADIEEEAASATLAVKYLQLVDMARYAQETGCLRNHVLKYFGEKPPKEGCGRCSSCIATAKRASAAPKKMPLKASKPIETTRRTTVYLESADGDLAQWACPSCGCVHELASGAFMNSCPDCGLLVRLRRHR